MTEQENDFERWLTKRASELSIGVEEGDPCNRNGCAGIIKLTRSENCSCHINPPCSSCAARHYFCPVCDWDENEEPE